jgi:SAM-dependent methyltransferase
MTDQPPGNPIAAVFDAASATYDRVGVDFFQPIADQLLGHLDPRPGERALDVGCGRGAVLFPLGRAVAPDGSAVGIDVSEQMVAATAAEAASLGLDVDVRVGDAVIGDDVGELDLVASSLVLFFLPDPVAALRSWHDHLVDGGRVGTSTFGPYNEEWQQVDAVLTAYRPAAVRDPRATDTTSPFASDAGVEGLFTSAGITGVVTHTSTVEVRFRDEDHWYEWSWSVGQRGMWQQVPEDRLQAVKDEAYGKLQGCRDGAGRIGFDQQVRFTLGRRGHPRTG